jgi:hypothetical protein
MFSVVHFLGCYDFRSIFHNRQLYRGVYISRYRVDVPSSVDLLFSIYGFGRMSEPIRAKFGIRGRTGPVKRRNDLFF